MANRGRPRKHIEEVDIMNEELEIIETNIGEMSDSLVTDGDIKVLGVITEDIKPESVIDDPEVVDEPEVILPIEKTLAVIDTDVTEFYALHYRDIREVGGGQFSFNLVSTIEEAEAWCVKGPENREDRTYNKFRLITVEI